MLCAACARSVGVAAQGGVGACGRTQRRSPVSCRAAPSRDDDAASVTRRAALLAGLASATVAPVILAGSAAGRQSVFDLPSCSKFTRAGALQYCDVKVGGGPPAEDGELIEVDFTARELEGGTVYEGARGFRFNLGQNEVIPGWEEAILGNSSGLDPIRVGGTRTVVIPAALAYGSRGKECGATNGYKCRVAPGTDVEITFSYSGLGYTNRFRPG